MAQTGEDYFYLDVFFWYIDCDMINQNLFIVP